jgi:hypothetical protein
VRGAVDCPLRLPCASRPTVAAASTLSASAERWFWITFSAGATEGHRNRDHERPWVMYSSRTCGSTRLRVSRSKAPYLKASW